MLDGPHPDVSISSTVLDPREESGSLAEFKAALPLYEISSFDFLSPEDNYARQLLWKFPPRARREPVHHSFGEHDLSYLQTLPDTHLTVFGLKKRHSLGPWIMVQCPEHKVGDAKLRHIGLYRFNNKFWVFTGGMAPHNLPYPVPVARALAPL